MSHQLPITSHLSLALRASQSLRTALRDAIAQLEGEYTPSAPLAAELLLMHILGSDRAWIYAHPEHELDAATRERYFSLIAQRASGVPTQYLTGHQEFWGLEFEVTPDVLIPRPETEHVIEVALERLGVGANGDSSRRNALLRIADIGTGSGCIAVALAKELPRTNIVATDISAAALEVARHNAARHDVAARIDFVECDLLNTVLHESRVTNHPSLALRASRSLPFDLIASNPPYIGRGEAATLPREVRDHEPEAALFAGETGTEIYAPLLAQAATLLKAGGILVLELGYNSADYVTGLLDAPQWADIAVTSDLAGIARVISTRRTA
jgi:release factor glutamine methyltransferase